MKNAMIYIFLIYLIFTACISCRDENEPPKYTTQNVILIIMDGARYTETWGDSTHQYIPRISEIFSKSGVVNTQFYNKGPTYTLAGHASITTGFYQEIDNAGVELPQHPSVFQYWNKAHINILKTSWIMSSKDKLTVLSNCLDSVWAGKFRPLTNCGDDGLGNDSRHDSITLMETLKVLSDQRPHLLLVNFREPDYSAHTGNWENYVRGIVNTDSYAAKIWEYCEQNSYYRGKTTLIITSDHGRHLNNVANGFISHGDDCDGCRHLAFYALGPDFKQGSVTNTHRELIDIFPTIAELLHLQVEFSSGNIMYELFKQNK